MIMNILLYVVLIIGIFCLIAPFVLTIFNIINLFKKKKIKEKPTGIAGGSSYAAQGPILPAARLRACGLFTCILLLATRKRVFKIQC